MKLKQYREIWEKRKLPSDAIIVKHKDRLDADGEPVYDMIAERQLPSMESFGWERYKEPKAPVEAGDGEKAQTGEASKEEVKPVLAKTEGLTEGEKKIAGQVEKTKEAPKPDEKVKPVK